MVQGENPEDHSSLASTLNDGEITDLMTSLNNLNSGQRSTNINVKQQLTLIKNTIHMI